MRKRFLPLRVDFRFDSVEKVLATGDRTFVKWAVVPLLPLEPRTKNRSRRPNRKSKRLQTTSH